MLTAVGLKEGFRTLGVKSVHRAVRRARLGVVMALAVALAPAGAPAGITSLLGPLAPGSAVATIYPSPGPMPPKLADCSTVSGPCASISPQCSHIVAPASASVGDYVELKTVPATPCNAWTYDELPGIQESACYLPDGQSGYIYPWGGVDLNVCRVRVDTSNVTLWHQTASGGWETTNGPGWAKVGVDDICGYGCPYYSNEDETWMAITPPPPPPPPPPTQSTGTKVHAGLKITFADSPSPVVVQQTTKGPLARTVKLTVTATNSGSDTIHGVSFGDPLDIVPVGHVPVGIDVSGCTWAKNAGLVKPTPPGQKAATPPPCPIEQAPVPPGQPAPARSIGDLAPGASGHVEFMLTIRGDGDYTIYDTVSGTRADPQGNQVAVNTVGSDHYQPDSQLLVMSVTDGKSQPSPKSSALLVAGTPFTKILHLENRSNYRRLLVLPKIRLDGNVVGGIVQETTDPVPANPPAAGTPAEVIPDPIIALDPRESHDYAVVFWSTRTDKQRSKGSKINRSTRGTITFDLPEIGTKDDNGTVSDHDNATYVVAPAHTFDSQDVHFDVSDPPQVPFNFETAGIAFSEGLQTAIWHATTSFLHGVYEIPGGIVSGVLAIPALIQKDIELEAQLYKEIKGDPALLTLYNNVLTHQVLFAFRYAPDLALSAAKTYQTVATAADNELARIYGDWLVGDWQAAVNDLSAETGDGVGTIGSLVAGPGALTKTLALAGEMGVLSRMKPVLQALARSGRAETAAGEGEVLSTGAQADTLAADAAAVRGGETAQTLARRSAAEEAVAKLIEDNKLPAGMTLDPNNPADLEAFARASGIDPVEAKRFAELAKSRRENLVCRSRGIGATDRLKQGAYLKPFEIKAKNMSPLDRWLFGWPQKLHDLVVIDADLPHATRPLKQALVDFGNDLQARGLAPGTAEYDGALSRYKTQWKQSNELLKKYRKWAAKTDTIVSKATGKVRGTFHGVAELTWDATENPRNFSTVPEFNPKAATKVRFRLRAVDAKGNVITNPAVQRARYYLPEIKPLGGNWGAISGDIDWLSFATAEGEQLDDARNIGLLNDLAHLGAQHPESASWVLNDKFLFDSKIEFLSGYDSVSSLEAAGGIGKQVNFEFGADGKIRTVVLDLNADASSFRSPTSTRVVWRHGYKHIDP